MHYDTYGRLGTLHLFQGDLGPERKKSFLPELRMENDVGHLGEEVLGFTPGASRRQRAIQVPGRDATDSILFPGIFPSFAPWPFPSLFAF